VTRHRGKIVLVMVVAALAATLYVGWRCLPGSGHRINPHTAAMVRVGMTQGEVEALFGVPPGDYSTEPKADKAEAPVPRRPDMRREDWTTEEGGAAVYFGPDGKVADCIIWAGPGYNASWFERLKRYRAKLW
jgi:hypothetical protein